MNENLPLLTLSFSSTLERDNKEAAFTAGKGGMKCLIRQLFVKIVIFNGCYVFRFERNLRFFMDLLWFCNGIKTIREFSKVYQFSFKTLVLFFDCDLNLDVEVLGNYQVFLSVTNIFISFY